MNNPVLQDIMPDQERGYFIEGLSDIIDLIGWNGGNAVEWGVTGKRDKKDVRNENSAKPNG